MLAKLLRQVHLPIKTVSDCVHSDCTRPRHAGMVPFASSATSPSLGLKTSVDSTRHLYASAAVVGPCRSEQPHTLCKFGVADDTVTPTRQGMHSNPVTS